MRAGAVPLEARGLHRRFAVMVPGFGALPAFLRGSPLLATAPSLLARRFMAGFGSCEVPVPCPPLPMKGTPKRTSSRPG